MSGPGSGDKLARGAVRAKFATTEGGVSDKQWNDMFTDFDPAAFQLKAVEEEAERNRKAEEREAAE